MTDYKTLYAKVKKLDLGKWILTRYFHYTSTAVNIMHEYDEMWHDKPTGDPYIKELYYHFWSIYKVYCGKDPWSMPDNKTTCEIMNIETNEKLYITSKDGRYYIGTSYWSEFGWHDVFGKVAFKKEDETKTE